MRQYKRPSEKKKFHAEMAEGEKIFQESKEKIKRDLEKLKKHREENVFLRENKMILQKKLQEELRKIFGCYLKAR